MYCFATLISQSPLISQKIFIWKILLLMSFLREHNFNFWEQQGTGAMTRSVAFCTAQFLLGHPVITMASYTLQTPPCVAHAKPPGPT